MGRVQAAVKNIAFGQIGNFITQILNFVLRTMFIHHLGDTLNGVNGLYTNMLSVLSMAELGIGTALNYSLYKPVARGDVEKVKSYMQLYKKAYRIIGIVIAVLGLACAPFLPYLIKSAEGIAVRDLTLYYFIFLFNTVSTYFVSYKYSLINAEQKNYIQTNIITITKMITVLLQMIVIVTTGNFYAYLLTAAGVELLQKIFVSYYLNHRYPYLKEKEVKKLSKEETGEIVTKTKALMLHKIGDVARLQTDSMIISGFISTTISGFVDNYNMVLNSVANVVNIIFNSVLSSFGNLFATESRQKQYQIFKVYRFAACWIYGFSAMGFSMLLTPLIQGAVNLVLSIVLVQRVGLVGIYIGTIVSGLIANVTKPIIIYKVILDQPVQEYFKDSAKYIVLLCVLFAALSAIKLAVMPSVTVLSFGVMFVIICVVFNGVFWLLFRKTEEFLYLQNLVTAKIKR